MEEDISKYSVVYFFSESNSHIFLIVVDTTESSPSIIWTELKRINYLVSSGKLLLKLDLLSWNERTKPSEFLQNKSKLPRISSDS